MFQQKVLQYLEQIQSKLNQNSSSHTLIPLFYNLIKFVENTATTRRFNYSNTLDSKYYFETRSLFQAFLQKHKKQNQRLVAQDKVMAYMLKSNSEMISSLNYRIKTTMYEKNVDENIQTDCINYNRHKSLDFNDEILFSDSLSVKSNNFENYIQKIQLQCQSQIIQSPKKIKTFKNENKKLDNRNSIFAKNSIELAPIDQVISQKVIKIQGESKIKGNPQNQLQSLCQSVMKLYEEHRLDQAFQELKKYKQLLKLKKSEISSATELSKRTIQQIEDQYNQMQKYHNFFDISTYTFDKKQDGMTMHYKKIEKQNLIAVHIEGEFQISLQKFLCIANQIQLYPNYVPFNYETKLLKNLGRNRKIGVSRVYLPFVSNRQAYFHAAAYDRLKSHNSIFMYSKSLQNIQALQKYSFQIPKSEMVSLDYKFFMLEYKPISKTRGNIKMSSCVDMNLQFIPKFILNKTARIFAFDYFKNMLKINKKFKGSQWQKALIQKPEVYLFFKQKIDEHFKGSALRN